MTCASEMLERGVLVPPTAEWIGDKLETFKEVYGNPSVEDVCRATLAGYVTLNHLHALLATFLLTGGRRSEVLGLERNEVDIENEYIHIRPNRWNEGLKTDHSERTVPLWPQLQSILADHLDSREDGHPLLFPLHWDEGKDHDSRMLNNIRSSLRSVEKRAELDKHLTPVVFRHTYTATRLQTTDNGAPVSIFTVARELGNRGIDRIEDTYGHLQRKRERLEKVRYE